MADRLRMASGEIEVGGYRGGLQARGSADKSGLPALLGQEGLRRGGAAVPACRRDIPE